MTNPLSSSEEQKRNAKLVAIVGMGCRWPGGVDSPRQMWSLLRSQGSGFRSFDASSTPRCFSAAGFHHPNSKRPGTTATDGAFMVDNDPRLFDHNFFNITGREAETLDPSQRKLLEVVYEAFENAGETWASVAGSSTGVFVGNFALDHWLIQARDWDYPRPHSTTGASASILANRISHVFDLRGPSVAVDTACSSSMYAVHLAVSAIQNGDCDAAIVAASNWIADPNLQIALDKLGALSPTSRCHTFDASADGYARGEGFAALYLQRLSDAVTGQSPIRAVIRGTAVNANGRSGGGITRPSADGQEAVIRKAYNNAGLPFSDTTYFECHGTGTPAGDPIELAAVGQVFTSQRTQGAHNLGPLYVGSVKTNMGHAEGASGLAAIMKVVLSLESGEIPPSVGVKTLNPNIDFANAGMEVVRQVTVWPNNRPLRASVNSFGFGGANGHCIIDHTSLLSLGRKGLSLPASSRSELNSHVLGEQAHHDHAGQSEAVHHLHGPIDENRGQKSYGTPEAGKQIHHAVTNTPRRTGTTLANTRQHVLLPFSAHNQSSLHLNIEALSRCIDQYALEDVAYTLSAKRSDFPYKTFRIVNKDSPAAGLLSAGSKLNFHTSSTYQRYQQPAAVAFVFTGQGAQWHGMGAQLFEYHVFRTVIEHLDNVLRALPTPPSTWSIGDVIKTDCGSDLIQTPTVSQTVCTAMQIALVDLLASWSVRPAAVVGHSSGEIAAAYASGRATATDAIIAAYLRGRAVTGAAGRKGAMLAVGLGPDQLREAGYLHDEDHGKGRVQIAAMNSPESVTLSGDEPAIMALATRLGDDGVFHRLLRTGGVAYHSHHMLVPGQEYEETLSHAIMRLDRAGLDDKRKTYAHVPWVSSVTPYMDPPSSIGDSAAYWRANLESPVRFSEAISNLACLGGTGESGSGSIKALLEIGPHSALKGPLEQILKSVGQTQIVYAGSTLKRGDNAVKSLLQLSGALYCLNVSVDLVAVNATDNNDDRFHGTGPEDPGVLVHGSLAVDLPPYQYTYGPINYYECRASKEHRLRKVPRHDLLGSKVSGTTKFRPQWRNVLRIKDVPWLGEHRLLPHVVFPAAGYIAMAIEAALRTHEESSGPCPEPAGYALRNVSIKSALRLPEDDHGVEVVLGMELSDTEPLASPSWANFSISSVGRTHIDSIDGVWTEHCTGAVQVKIGIPLVKIERIATASTETRVIDTQSWYETFEGIGLSYGPSFQAISTVHADPDKKLALASIGLRTTEERVQGGESRYALHPTILDATFQLGLISCHGGQVETARTAFVPVHFPRIYIKDGTNEGDAETATAIAQGEFRGLRGAYVTQLQMLDLDGNVVLNIDKLRCVSYAGETQLSHKQIRDEPQPFSSPFARMVWKPDFLSLSNRSCRTLFPPPGENVTRHISIRKLTKLAAAIIADVYETFGKASTEAAIPPTPSGNTGHFFSWIKRCFEDAKIPEIAQYGRLSAQERYETIGHLYHEIEDIVEAQIAKRLHENMADILFERRTGLDIMIHGGEEANLLPALYQHGIFMTSAYSQLARVLDGLAHANPHLRILEVGAGTGGATRVAMKALTGPNGIKRYRKYVFTDVSPGFLAATQASMAGFSDLSYSVLDIATDPVIQGYQPVFDVVLASQALHATPEMLQTLKNCRKLLLPQGKLVLVENITENNIVTGLILGTLAGYWHGIPDGRVNGPFVGLQTWDAILLKAGFSGTELVLDDYPRPDNATTTIVSSTLVDSRVAQEKNETAGMEFGPVKFHLLHNAESEPPLLCRLHRELERRGESVQAAPLGQSLNTVSPDDHVVALLDGESDFLLDAEGQHLASFQHLARNAATLLCLTFCGFSRGRNPDGALIPGLLRTLGTENPEGRFISIDVSDETSQPATYDSEHLVHCVVDKLFLSPDAPQDGKEENGSPQMREREYVWQNDCLWVSRVVPDGDLETRLQLDRQSPFRATFSKPGILSSLSFRPYTELLAPIPSNHIDVKVAAVGINWKDLAVSSGRFDADNLSSEYSGTVTAVGPGAAGLFSVGDRVYGMGPGHFGSHTRVPAAFAQKLTIQDDLVDVATMPLVFMTAIYAFDHVARLRPGQKVLIQSATGGLGLAAIQLARAKGAEIFAMVGTAEKAKFLIQEMQLPEPHVIVIASRDCASDIDEALLRMTARGRGFDVILATARGDVLRASAQALAPLGHLVDVGRTDVQESKTLGMELFSKSASFSSFDLSAVLDADTTLGSELMKAVHQYYRAGLIGPVRPTSVTDISKLDQALLRFSKGTHLGKLLVTVPGSQTLFGLPQMPTEPQVRFEAAATYVVVGGLGGLGRSIVRWMCQRGAHNLVILSRRGLKDSCSAAQKLVGMLNERRYNIKSLTCNISDGPAVSRAIHGISSTFPQAPIRGIILAAVSYLDLSFDKLTVSQWRESLAAKVQGTKNLHEATLSLPPGQLDFFVMVTSLESVLALATQSAYTAANAFQEAFARYRQRLGMPATSVSLGFVKDVGELGQDPVTVDMFARNRVLTLSEGEFLVRLERAFLNSKIGGMSSGTYDGDGESSGWVGPAEDPLSVSNIFTCLDPGAMAARERDDEAKSLNGGLGRPLRSIVPRWYSDARVSHVMRALEDARRDDRAVLSGAAAQGNPDDSAGKSSVGRIRQQFDAAVTAAGASKQRSSTVDFVTGAITAAVAEMLFVDISNVNPARAVADHGVDSLIASELRNWFHQALGARMNMQELLDVRTSIAALAGRIVDAALGSRHNEERGAQGRENGAKIQS